MPADSTDPKRPRPAAARDFRAQVARATRAAIELPPHWTGTDAHGQPCDLDTRFEVAPGRARDGKGN